MAAATDSPSTALVRAVEIMDRLRSPGGCPWDAEQTHESLARYLLEETYETLEAIESGDSAHLREELGDLLLQVLFHARVAEELPADQRFTIDDVAGDLVDKLVRRHPHVFVSASAVATSTVTASTVATSTVTAADVEQNWEQLKASEKKRTSLTEGVPTAQPALALAAALLERVKRAGLVVKSPTEPVRTDADTDIGQQLFALVRAAVDQGVDSESALRQVTRRYREAILAAEQGLRA
jgi:XTP/dITP diphosphohydrolase